MIHTSTQLKALVRNKSHGDNAKAMTLIRNVIMERFLERMSLSKYSGNLILKGGLLIASMVGLDNRATMDIDTTIRNYNLSPEDARKVIEDIIATPLDDETRFEVKSVERIMDEAEYPGIRFKLEAVLDTMKTPLKIDISTDDVITPKEVNYEYKLMFEERSISLLAYNLETVLAEKMETIISRGNLNTRMRDYYDLMILNVVKSDAINYSDLAKALEAASRKRKSYELLSAPKHILEQIKSDAGLMEQWGIYQRKYDYAADYNWEDIVKNIEQLFEKLM
ncbi:MAG: nucleotidyl transferase AbiEii/AbiGii toxin family protein [Lachnospiraceae bacterium]|nr:nucleotidyl transferase AbiEii/AbiGii toxin family protein [Lachnospiraceae bacterium]